MKQRFSTRTRLISALLTLAMVFTFLPFSAFADDEVDFWVPLHSENFPDKTFLEYIRTTFDKGGSEDGEPNGILEPGEWRAVTTIDVRNKNITSLWGITCFRNLKKLNCSDNQLTSLDLSYNTKLTPENFECSGNKYPIQSAGADHYQNQAGESPCKHPQKWQNAGRDRCYSGQRSRRL